MTATIRTQRLLLRGWRPDDRPPFAPVERRPGGPSSPPAPIPPEASDAFTDAIEEHWRIHGWGLWAVEVPGSARFIGYVGLWPVAYLPTGAAVEIGWRLARPYWGRGYATEAAREGLRFGSKEVGLEEIVSFTVPRNERSVRVMERIGLRRYPAGDFDHPHVDPVRYPELVRHVMFRVRRAEWLRRTPLEFES